MTSLPWTRLEHTALGTARFRSSERRSEIISSYCHDIRQPLGAALLRTATLLDDELDPRRRVIVEELHKNLQEIAQTGEAVFDAIRLTRSAIRPRVSSVDLGRLFRHLITVLEGPARAKGVKLRCVATNWIADTDEWLLTRVLQNLGSNAVKYTSRGAVLVTCRRVDRSLRFEVRDSGPGLSGDALKRLLNNERNQEEWGGLAYQAGLGLQNSCEFARLLGGNLSVASAQGQGTRFRLDLTCPHERRKPLRAHQHSATRQLTVAVLMEDQFSAEDIARSFTRAGWKSSTYSDPMLLLAAVTAPGFRPSAIVLSSQIGSITAEFLLRIVLSRYEDMKAMVLFGKPRTSPIQALFERNVHVVYGDVADADICVLEKMVSPPSTDRAMAGLSS